MTELDVSGPPVAVTSIDVQHPPPEWPDTLLDGTRGRAEVFREALIAERSGTRPPPESATVERAPESLQDAHEPIEALRESLEKAWEAIELHEKMLRTLRNAVAAAPILKRDLDPVLFALDAIDARKAGGQ